MTRFLWVNNVTSLTGGTTQATLCMLRAFPECEHTVLCRSGNWSEDDKRIFGSNVSLVSGKTVNDVLGEQEHDIIVYQNSPSDFIPMQHIGNPLTFYYTHSMRRDANACAARCHKSAVVSKFLKGKIDSPSPVLYQPVLKVEQNRHRDTGLSVVRICTPNPKKWKPVDYMGSLTAVRGTHKVERIVLVGCPEPDKKEVEARIGPVEFRDASFEARSVLGECSILLYDTSIEETYGRVVREAQRAGCIPVVKRIGGFTEQIVYGLDGFLCNHDEDFAAAVHYLSNSVVENGVRDTTIATGEREGSLSVFRERFIGLLTA